MNQLTSPPPESIQVSKSVGFWKEAWSRFRRRKMAMTAFYFVCFLAVVALLAPAIAGTKPIVCKYKGHLYFPAMGYFEPTWENPIFQKDRFRKRYPKNLKEKDPDSWAVWPLVYQDPYRRIREDEMPGQPGNPARDEGTPNRYNIFGTDTRGVDVFAQIVHGTTIALLVGFVSMGIASVIGITLGSLAGFLGGWTDMVISRTIEVVMCVPTLVLILALIAIIDRPTIWHVMAVIGLTGWTGIARLTRAEFLKLKQTEFVSAARALGYKPLRIVFRHILPNAMAPVLVPISFGVASAILIEASLSFLGFGTPPPNPSWGTLLQTARNNLDMWWMTFFPGTAIFLAVLAYNLIGEGLQHATDPRLRSG